MAYGMGGGLANYGMGQQQEATQMLGEVAKQEAQRDMENKSLRQQAKAGNTQLGATAGAMYGSTFGPWGALAGGLIGGLLGGSL